MHIVLSEEDQRRVRKIAKRRYESDREAEIVDRKIGPQSSEFTDLNGLGGEVAAARTLGVEADWSLQISEEDLTLPDGRTVDVKTTAYEDGMLLCPTWKEVRTGVDIYVLVTGEFPEYHVRGWQTSGYLFKSENIVNVGYGPSFGVSQEDLKPMEDLT